MLRRRPVMRTVARTAVIAGTATAVAGGVRRHQDSKAQQAQGAAQPQEQAAPEPAQGAPVPGSQEAIDQLKELAQLHEQGILTDDEFAAQKAKLLG